VLAAVDYAGPEGGFSCSEQVNVLMLSGLSGRGEGEIVMTMDACNTNTVRVSIR
jgi:hypothetical protein